MICKIEVAPKLLKCTNFGATFLYRRLVREQVNTYEKWSVLDSKSPIAIGESSEQNSTIAIGELQSEDYQIDIYRSLSVDNVVDFPIEVFFSVPFTHHIRILEKTQTQEERYYYMHRCVMENLSVDGLVKIIKQDDFLHKSILPNNFVNTISDPATARKAVLMFKDEYFPSV